ncbi:MAG: NAD(P)H-hydrate dehydratase [Chloroflexi bacterium]|nr:NAD(P)H-hydrate dehydratase [Chloroflexota bacterium]
MAVDCPSGLNCDSGALDELALPASLTVTFAGAKRGHFRFPGAAACGELVVADIGIPADLPDVAQVQVAVMTAADARERQPKRPLSGHKGTFGTAVIAAGSTHYWGRAHPGRQSRLPGGGGPGRPGRAHNHSRRLRHPTAGSHLPLIPDSQILGPASVSVLQATKGDALLIGPGLDAADAFITDLLAAKETLPPLVIDADGLNVLASKEAWWKRLPPHTILTPHPGEMARLMGVTLADLQERDRVALAQEKAAAWGCVLLLKGAYTVIAAPDGRLTINPFANPALAVAGSGDVLSGVITGLLAQGVAPFDAARLGAYLHGAAAAQYAYDSGLLMRELCDFLPEVMAREK